MKELFFCFFMVAFFSNGAFPQTSNWIAPEDAKTMKNPVFPTIEVIAEGKNIYMQGCAPCHGEKGKGNGPSSRALKTFNEAIKLLNNKRPEKHSKCKFCSWANDEWKFE